MDPLEIAVRLGIFFVPFLFSLCFHEYAHGWVAKLRGDNTAQMMGRLTMNPVVHMDMIGTLILPIVSILFNSPILFGWAKPVPVNPNRLKSPRSDLFWVALAGPLSNVLLAIVGAVALVLVALNFRTHGMYSTFVSILQMFITLNLFLAFFNIIPLPPLDGSKVIGRFLPAEWVAKMEQNEGISSLVLMALILSGGLRLLVIPVEWSSNLLIHAALGFFA